MIGPTNIKLANGSIDLTGQTFGRLKVLYFKGRGNHRTNLWVCQCECGNIRITNTYSLTKQLTRSCGCLSREALAKVREVRNAKLRESMIGKTFGRLTVKSFSGVGNKLSIYECACECGNSVSVRGHDLVSGNTQSCGCYNKERTSESTKKKADEVRKSVIGKVFGRLTVVEYDGPNKQGRSRYKCQCECGNTAVVNYNNLMRGGTVSCGCYAKETASNNHKTHGMFGTRIYNIWSGIVQRCTNINSTNYPAYGGRGIGVCPEWRASFQAFYDWSMAHGYQENLTIDRIDNYKGYSPDNCRWATWTEQNNNKRGRPVDPEKAESIKNDPRSYREIASDYQVSLSTISKIKNDSQ